MKETNTERVIEFKKEYATLLSCMLIICAFGIVTAGVLLQFIIPALFAVMYPICFKVWKTGNVTVIGVLSGILSSIIGLLLCFVFMFIFW